MQRALWFAFLSFMSKVSFALPAVYPPFVILPENKPPPAYGSPLTPPNSPRIDFPTIFKPIDAPPIYPPPTKSPSPPTYPSPPLGHIIKSPSPSPMPPVVQEMMPPSIAYAAPPPAPSYAESLRVGGMMMISMICFMGVIAFY